MRFTAILLLSLCGTLANGQFKFRMPASTTIPNTPEELAKGDFNNDGLTDFVSVHFNAFANQQLTVLLNTGTGTFTGTNVRNFASATNSLDVAVGDFNEDGSLDVVACSQSNDNFSLLTGNGAGDLSAPTHFDAGDTPQGIAVADLNKDNNLDVLVSCRGTPSTVHIYLGNGNGTFAAPTILPITNAWDVAVADFNGDTNPDLAVSITSPGSVQVFLGNGSGTTFTPQATIAGFSGTEDVLAVNLDNDADIDILAGGGYSLNAGDATFAPRVGLIQTNGEYTTGDINKDGNIDIIANDHNQNTTNMRVFLGDGAGTFTLLAKFEGTIFFNGVEIADVNNDTNPDVVGVGAWSGTPAANVWLGDGTGFFLNTVTKYPSPNDPRDLVKGDFNEDGLIDIAVCHSAGNFVTIYLGQGNEKFSRTTSNYTTGAFPSQLVTIDYNKDGHTDLISFNQTAASVTLLSGVGDGSFTVLGSLPVTNATFGRMATGDFNKDGNPDLAVSGGTSNVLNILAGNGTTLGSSVTTPVSNNLHEIKAADFNGDGNIDLVGDLENIDRMALLTGSGTGAFTEGTTQYARSGGYYLVADLNNDTHQDVIAFANSSSGSDFFVNDGTGNFTGSSVAVSLGGIANGYHDMDNDGFKDLVVTAQNSNSSEPGQVVIFRGSAGGITNTVMIDKDYSGGNRALLHDVNDDGRMDIIVNSFNIYEDYLGVLINDSGAPACTPPSATITPSSTVCIGQAVTITATTTGTAPFTYQWRKGGIDLSGEISASLTLASAVAGDAGNYTCVVTNSCGNFTTPASTLTVLSSIPGPSATGSSSCVPAALTLAASGATNGQYRWYTVQTGGTAISGEVNSTYTTPLLSVTTTYYVSINNGTCESSRIPVNATIAPLAKPNVFFDPPIFHQGSPIVVCEGYPQQFVGPDGFSQYTWSNGQTTQAITIDQPGTYSLVVEDASGCVSPPSDPLTVAVNPYPAATITVDGSELIASVGDSYQWYENGAPVPNSDNQTFPLNTLEYGVYAVAVTDDGCTAVSEDFVYLITGAETATGGIKVFPNPFKDRLMVDAAEQQVLLEIIDPLGKSILTTRANGSMELKLDALPQGSYLLLIHRNNKTNRIRIIKIF